MLLSVASGAFVSLFSMVTTRLGKVEDVGVRTGVQMTIMSLSQRTILHLISVCANNTRVQEHWLGHQSQAQSSRVLDRSMVSVSMRVSPPL